MTRKITGSGIAAAAVSDQAQYILGIILVTCAWACFFLDYDNNLYLLASSSQGIRALASEPGTLVALGLLGSYGAILMTSWLLLARLHVFVALWLFSLAVSEAAVPVLQPVMMFLRYAMMLALIVYGLLEFFGTASSRWFALQWLAVAMLLLLLVRLAMGPADVEACLMLPMQIALFVGVFFGFAGRLRTETRLDSLAYAIVAVGMVVTLINLAGLVLAPMPFDQGRFKSWYLLATGFANNYVLFLIPMVWCLMFARHVALKGLCLLGVLAGTYLIVLSGSRNALGVLTLATFLMCALWRPGYLIYIGIGLVLALGAVYTMDLGLMDLGRTGARISSISEREVRFGVWSLAWSYIQHHFWLGYGLSASLRDLSALLPEWERFDAHNAYLGIWLRLGLTGLAIYLAMYFQAIRQGLKYLLAERAQQKGVMVLFFSILCALFVAGLFEENLSSRGSVQQGMWALCAVAVTAIAHRSVRMTNNRRVTL